MLRQNTWIKVSKNKDKLLAQFADDTTLFLDSNEQSSNKAFWTLQRFAKMSYLKMNNDKTKVIWIGGKKRYQAQFLRDMNFCWDTSIYLAFRIKISANIDHINVIN